MEFMTPIQIAPLADGIHYSQKIMLMGSCFTEHIGNALALHKFDIMQNPHGILFDPASVAHSIVSYIDNKTYTADDLFYLNEVWQSWHHHSRFASINKDEALDMINASQHTAHDYLQQADWLIITLGSSFSYQLTGINPDQSKQGLQVANCHRAPSQWFYKKMLEINETIALLDTCYHRLKHFNPKLKIIFTISPVRHLRDGVVDNNRSKSRLIEAVHHTVNKFENLYYFPAYELVIDVLRDYRFYDIDFAHPNYQATQFVLEKFTENYIDAPSQELMGVIKKIMIAYQHKPFQPNTEAHRRFLQTHLQKARDLVTRHPYLDFSKEIAYFSENL